jgi:Glycosyltransferases, probably involved in cell wall biogenesis
MEAQQKELVFWAMWWGWWLLQAGLYTLFTFLFLDAAYQFVIGFRGWWSARPLPEAKSFRRFAVLVPAHNEAAVLDGLMESLNLQEYPRDRFDVYVSCDNCSDNTAEVAAARRGRCPRPGGHDEERQDMERPLGSPANPARGLRRAGHVRCR